MKIRQLFILTLFTCGLWCKAQVAHLYTMRQGLRSSYISSLFVDEENFLWVSTDNSLEVFDGHRFQEIDYNNPENGSPLFNKVNSISQLDAERYWMMTNVGLFIYDKSKNQFEQVRISDNTEVNRSSIQQAVAYPGKKRTLFSSEGHGFFVIDNEKLTCDTGLSDKLTALVGNTFIRNMLVDSQGRLFVSDFRNESSCIDLAKLKKLPINITAEAKKLMSDSFVMSSVEDSETGKIVMAMSHNGVLVYDSKTNTIDELKHNQRSLYCTSIIKTQFGDIFVGTDNLGILDLNLTDETLVPYKEEVTEVDIHDVKVHALTEDKGGNLIVGIYQKGVLMLHDTNGGFLYQAYSSKGNDKNSSCVTSFCKDNDGSLWVGTDGAGVFHEGQCIQAGLSSLLVQSLVCDASGRIWCGSWRGGLSYYQDGSFHVPAFLSEYVNANVMDLVYDSKQNIIYAGTSGEGVLKVDLTTQKAGNINGSENFRWVNRLHLDSDGVLWIGDAVTLFRYDPQTGVYQEVKIHEDDIAVVNSFCEDGDLLLIGTSKGTFCYDRKKKQEVVPSYLGQVPTSIDIKNIEEASGHLWLSTNRDILCIDKQSGKLTRYDSFNGNYIGEFHIGASIRLDDGTLYFGGDNGSLRFKAKELLEFPNKIMQVYLSPIWLGNKLDGSNSYHLTFCVPDYTSPDRINYAYQLEGYESEWHTTSSDSPEAYYASLPSGSYIFKVRAFYSDNPEQYTEQSIRVNVPYPWYATWWAYLLYALILGVIGYYVYMNIREKQKSKAMLIEAEQKERVKEDKLRLFTSIAHELRSPLTMIMSPLRQLVVSDRDLNRQGSYSIMQRNCGRIQRIVNQMLDVRKIDNGQFRLHFSETDLNTYTKEVMESFRGIAAAKDISFTHESTEDNLPIWVDTLHFEKVLFNLLSNAFKYTPDSGRVIVRTSSHPNSTDDQNHRVMDDFRVSEYAEIKIYNSGSHIYEADIDHLWERFYQGQSSEGKEGSGIGLNFAYELMKLHHGTIEAHNIGGDGVEFIVRLPKGNAHLSEDEKTTRKEKKENESFSIPAKEISNLEETAETTVQPVESEPRTVNSASKNNGPTSAEIIEDSGNKQSKKRKLDDKELILVVDDDKELSSYVSGALSKTYNTLTAHSGNDAWKLILTHRPTIVVTDLMMPDGDGYDLCRRIKSNPETDHIAVIVLTSESDEDSQLRSMNLQADHFLPKPFNLPLLNSAVSQVIRVRENIRNKIRRTDVGNSYGSIEIDSYEDKFIQRVKELVLSNIDNPDFNVNELSKEVGLSRVHLNRKLKEHFGISPNAYLRSVRLKQAAYLLVNNKVNISEVAYRVGFSSHSYFTSIFHDYFGMSPKEFVATYSQNLNDETLQKLLE